MVKFDLLPTLERKVDISRCDISLVTDEELNGHASGKS
jgi:hypothetical protein